MKQEQIPMDFTLQERAQEQVATPTALAQLQVPTELLAHCNREALFLRLVRRFKTTLAR